jgi:hypothetical protein
MLSEKTINFNLKLLLIFSFSGLLTFIPENTFAQPYKLYQSIRDFGVLPENRAKENSRCLQEAIDWASSRGAALFVEPSNEPYPMDGGIVLRQNVSLIGVHGPVGRGTRHPQKVQPVGSVFRIEDTDKVFISVEGSSQIRGIQFWYPNQTLSESDKIISYPPTIQVSQTTAVNGVTLSCLTFYGEYIAMDFNSNPQHPCEQILFEHCYGYPLSGQFIRIDRCYDIPRILHCHINPANRRYIEGQYSPSVIDAVIGKKTFAYAINRTDNAQVIDVFSFGTYGGIYLGPATYGQMTNFNFDCVTVGIHKLGNNSKNRNWQIAQGSIIANTGDALKDVHPIIIEGKGHTALINVEAFSGANSALTTLNKSQDFLLVRGNEKLTISMYGCRMRNYKAENAITIENQHAIIQATDCIDKDENPFNLHLNSHHQ